VNIIFFGSSEFSIPALRACLDSPHEVILAITTPDKKQGRGLKVLPTAVRRYAEEKNIPLEAVENLKDVPFFQKISGLKPDFFVVSSYGKLIPASWLQMPSQLSLNVHPSLLPKYRGAAPIHWPIIHGDSQTGITIAEVTSKLDSGDIFYQERIPLDPRVDAKKLSHQLAELSYKALQIVFKQIEEGTLSRIPQQEHLSSYARKLTKEDGRLSLKDSAVRLDRLIRGLQPWPGSFLEFQQAHLLILEAEPSAVPASEKAGTLVEIGNDGSIALATGNGILKIKRVRPAGKKEMSAADFVRGRHLPPGFVFE
jgi:methionyl-tRNA formyltransferase